MTQVTVSPKYQIVIPKDIRKDMDIKPGMKVEVYCDEDGLQIVPIKSMKDLRGSLKGMDTTIVRESDREL